MISRSLRHFRVFLSVAATGSPSHAAEICRVSQPAVTQAIGKLEREAGGPLFERTRKGFFLADRGRLLEARLRRAMDRLDIALAEVSPRLTVTATVPQLQALIAVAEAQSFTLAARALGLAQPTVHRAITQLEQEAARALFERTSFGIVATRPCRDLAQAARLAFSEIEQAEADLAEAEGREAGRIVVGALPLSRSVVLPEALARFRAIRPRQPVTVLDGPYDEMLTGLRRGDIDVILGALRDPAPVPDVRQEPLFVDHLTVLARPGHPLAGGGDVTVAELQRRAWCVPRPGTPARVQFDALFAGAGLDLPESIVECGSILLMRELLARSDLLGCISDRQAEAEVAKGLLVRLSTGLTWSGRPIGLTTRAGWVPTRGQALLLDGIRAVAAEMAEA
ncbi:LysR family transcriptional regulator [Rhodobacterales bacterium HKCCE2091]|nr:LysR family transcriptional regulator [Rhodobacterales bacterium HKCCE2091]